MEMDRTLTNLSRVLRVLAPGDGIDTPDQRATAQNAVYFAQAIGINLHYPFCLRARGLFSPDLVRDHNKLHGHTEDQRRDLARMPIQEPFASALERIRQLMRVPEQVALTRRQWLDVLSSVRHLRTCEEWDRTYWRHRLEAGNPNIPPYEDEAARALTAQGLL